MALGFCGLLSTAHGRNGNILCTELGLGLTMDSMLHAIAREKESCGPPATELVRTTRFTEFSALAADLRTLVVPFSAGSMRSSCGLDVSMKNGDLQPDS